MHKLYIFGAVVSSAMLGFLYGHQYALRKHKKEIAAWGVGEVQRMRDIFESRLKDHNIPLNEGVRDHDDTPATEDKVVERTNPQGVSMSSLPGSYKDYSKIRDDYKRKFDEIDPMSGVDGVEGEIYESFAEGLDFEDDEMPDGLIADQTPRGGIYQIDVPDFLDPAKPYVEYTFTYYLHDKVLVDENMVPIDKIDEMIGDHLGIFDRNEQGDTDVIFVRNDNVKMDCEIIVEEEESLADATARWKAAREKRRMKNNE